MTIDNTSPTQIPTSKIERALVIGQGLAGSWMAWYLLHSGVHVDVVDHGDADSSSRVAAGLINPVTGRRLHTSWKGEEVTTHAYDAYAHVARTLGVTSLTHRELRRVFRDNDTAAVYNKRVQSAEFSWLSLQALAPGAHDGIDFPHGGFALQAATVDTTLFLDAMHAYLHVRKARVNAEWLQQNAQSYDVLVWCDGWTAQHNDLWSWLQFAPVKGEILDVHIPGLSVDYIISSSIWLIPLGNERYRLGSTYDWEDLTTTATPAARATLVWQAEALIGRPIVVEHHRAGVRPATHSRRPYAGRHPIHANNVIFNGLGTKGALLAPWTAHQLTAHLLHAVPLDPEIDIQQWWPTQ